MKYRALGQTKMTVSELVLGTMTYGVQTSEDDAFAQMDMALDAGINSFDTAELYPVLPLSRDTQGESERIIGRWIKARNNRDQVQVFTKIAGINNNTARDGSPITPKAIQNALERSLQNLQTDHVELYQLHWPNRPHYWFRKNWGYEVNPDDAKSHEDSLLSCLEALGELVKQGKIKAYGVSNDTAWGVMKLLELSKSHNLPRLASIQNEYSLMCRLFEPDLQEVCLYENVSLLTYSSLAGGLLSGKYGRRGEIIPNHSRRSIEPNVGGRVNEVSWDVVDRYLDIAKRAGIDPVHFAYRFALSKNFVSAVIIGATNQGQLQQILSDDYQPLPADVMAEIENLRREYPIPF